MHETPMNVTATGIAVGIAVIVAVGLLFFGPQIFAPFQNKTATSLTTSTTTAMEDSGTTISGDTSLTGATPNPGSNAAPTPPQIPANVTQLMMSDQVVGTGAVAQNGDQVTVQYVGELTNGTIFDASANHGTQGFTFTLGAGQVIKGWDQGVAGMKVGGKRELVIPASLGYGPQSVGSIPANSTLVFEVELINVQSPQQ